ncbi:LysR family transcriptional regulator [Pseudacidovorax sp. RU35E]|uniref:LysR family transcriptional regulator n=1 Tax=Pseudacidovorax sp. RU35E TaxID=1907403 RepID=UPI000970AFEB|nr:LysR family transcriptional regulator [Pseudacidovorax sp. RU35E]
MKLTVRQLRYFVAIAQGRSFSRAAAQLAIAQPALSQNIAALEELMGVRLFERHARGVDLSAAGERLLTEALELLARLDTLPAQVAGSEARIQGVVRLAMAGSLAAVVVAPLLRLVRQRHPGVSLEVSEGLSSEVRMRLESGRVHLAVMPGASELQGIASLPLYEERFMLYGAVAAMQALPAVPSFARVASLPLAEPDGAHDLRKIIERAATQQGLRLDVRHELNSPPMLMAVVREGLAFAIMPPSACVDAVALGEVQGRPIRGGDLARVQAVAWPESPAPGLAEVAVRDLVVEVVHGLIAQGRLPGRRLRAAPATHTES